MKNALFFVILTRGAASFIFAQKPHMGGVSTGEAKTYAAKRTTGIVNPNARKIYEDVTANTALANFRCVSGANKNYIIETTACTVAVFDYDNDGKPDIYLLNGSTMNAKRGREKAVKSALYRNLGRAEKSGSSALLVQLFSVSW